MKANLAFDKIEIEFIPHDQHRYPTVGDWLIATGMNGEKILNIRVSKLSDWRREALIAVHELVEVLLCRKDGVTQKEVDVFDRNFEANRPDGCDDEPGDDSDAPYRKQHCFATGVERLLAAELNVDWKAYEQELYKL